MRMLALQALIMVPVTPFFNTDDNLDYSDTVLYIYNICMRSRVYENDWLPDTKTFIITSNVKKKTVKKH